MNTETEFDRVLKISEYDLDYSINSNILDNLSRLAAHIADTPISLINIVASNTQWSLSSHGMDLEQMARDESICQYTIHEDEFFEASNMDKNPELSTRSYVEGDPKVKYYFGVPMRTPDGFNIGSLCVMDQEQHSFSREQIEMLKILSSNIVTVLEQIKQEKELNQKLEDLADQSRKLSHDIRGPIGGIIGLSQLIQKQHNQGSEEFQEMSSLIINSGKTIIELADEILSGKKTKEELNIDSISLTELIEKLHHLYQPQALTKNIKLNFSIIDGDDAIKFHRFKLLQIIGNLCSNAIKFTPEQGNVTIEFSIVEKKGFAELNFSIHDDGIGMSAESVQEMLSSEPTKSLPGTNNECGFGFGFQLARYLISSLNGHLEIESKLDEGTKISVSLIVKLA